MTDKTKGESQEDEVIEDDVQLDEEEEQKEDPNGEKKPESLTDDERAELEKLRNKDLNFKRLKEKYEKKSTEGEENEKEGKSDVADTILAETGKDLSESVRAKAKYFFNKIAGTIKDPTLQRAFMQDAIRMAENPLNLGGEVNKVIPNGGGRTTRPTDKDTRTPEAKQIQKNLGVSDDDRKKYSGSNWKPKYVNPSKNNE